MLRRVVYVLRDHRSLIAQATRSMSNKPNLNQDSKPTGSQDPAKEPLEYQDPNEYEDFGDVKIKKGGRTIKVDESESAPQGIAYYSSHVY